MAQKLDKEIDKAIGKMMKEYNKAAINAAQFATKQVMKDFINEAFNGLERYYSDYKPKSYNRTYTLAECIVPFSEISSGNDSINCVMRINYDSTRLADYYDYDYGDGKPSRFYRGQNVPGKIIPDEYNPINEFIMNNFLEGIHPTTDGSSSINAEYIKIQKTGIEHLIDKYVRHMESDFADYFTISLLGQLKNY